MKQGYRQKYQAKDFPVKVHQNIIYNLLPLSPQKFKKKMEDADNIRLVSKVTSCLLRLNIEKFKQNH